MKVLTVTSDGRLKQAAVQALTADGHSVLHASGCGDALTQYVKHSPDLVLVDISLSDGDGYQCVTRLRALGQDLYAPIILSASIDDHVSLTRFVECGATDFIDEPCDHFVLRAKVNGHAQTREIYRHLELAHEKIHREVAFAKHMFSSVLGRSPADVQGLQHWSISAGHFCGDLMLYEETPGGGLNILLGDFTGHGLAAAVGALPASDVFFAMSRKGLPLGEIATEINRKLHHLLPTGHFCAATLASLDIENGRLETWIGGQPPLLLIDRTHHLANPIESEHLPLGVLPVDDFDSTTRLCDSIESYSHLLLYSDGLIEARNGVGEMFGMERLSPLFSQGARKSGLMQGIKSRLISFLDGLEPTDDVSVLAMELSSVA
jgi:serine phosphatase RsbU (regulator of sigma subunit)/CheY-like chemotaxis protein